MTFLWAAAGFVLGVVVTAIALGRKIARLKLDVFFLELERDLRRDNS